MSKFSFVLLYVDNPPTSAAFYADPGLPFAALDPDDHRLRVLAPAAA